MPLSNVSSIKSLLLCISQKKERPIMAIRSIISASGSFIPDHVIPNTDFLDNKFYERKDEPVARENTDVIQKFQDITTIGQRRYADDGLLASDMGYLAAEEAIISGDIDRETIDYIIVGHNFGDIRPDTNRVDIVPSVASKVKQKLGIQNPECVAFDVIFGCPGWLHGFIQAHIAIKAGEIKRALIIGADTVSRVADPHDRDSMIYADGAGATIIEAIETDDQCGVIAHATRSDTLQYATMLFMGESYNSDDEENLYLKMNGRKLYQYALEHVPIAIKSCLDKANIGIEQVKKVLIHQANGKMDEAILKRLYQLYNLPVIADEIMPMSISWLGNSSVATVPTLFDLIVKGQMPDHSFEKGDIIVLASVGAGMNINAVVYKF
jgi:3-oxoacyl-[acyl-carrier-protein] synthase III